MMRAQVDHNAVSMEMAIAGDNGRLFEQLFECYRQELCIFHPTTLAFEAINRAARNNLGFTGEQWNRMTAADLVPEFILETFQSLLRPLVRGDQAQVAIHTYIRRQDGSLYPAEVNIQLFGYNGEKHCLALINDLSKVEDLADCLREKEMTLNAVMDAAQDAVIMLDQYGKVTYWNHAAEELFGFTREEILGKNLHPLIAKESQTAEVYQKTFREFQASGKGVQVGNAVEVTAKKKDGREVEVALSLSALKIQNSWHAIGIVHDISQQKQSKRELENSRQKYLDLAENAPIGILSCDLEGNITFVNQRALDILGSPGSDETRKINLLTFPLLIKHGFSRNLAGCLQKNSACSFELSYKSKWNKQVWLKVYTKPQISQGAAVGAQIIIDDISERKQLEEKLLNLSITDNLTEAYNRRYFIQRLEAEIDRNRRAGNPFSVIMADIDHFKTINDRLGHDRGDVVLKKITSEMMRKIRKMDTLARWGGDEFMLLTAETSVEQAYVVAERIRSCLCDLMIPDVGTVTASFGVVAGFAGDTVDSIVQRVDGALYEAKSAGRNCVRLVDEFSLQPPEQGQSGQ